MARGKSAEASGSAFDSAGAVITETPLQDEVSTSYLEYAYSVIHSRALPDARDGLKPVHRRILFGMSEAGLRPDHAYVKSARVVGDVMGRYHPHGDSAIYDALVRLAQPFATATPLIDGHGNFGSPNDPPAAMRYTECRLSNEAMLMVRELNENTVDMGLNYDGSLKEPTVLPAAFPYLLVNGSTGIAVGMATNMIPHNLGEVIDATRLLLKKPSVGVDELMEVLPGPDLPTGGTVIGLDQVRAAYETGKGAVRIRAHVNIEPAGRGRQALIVTALPYGVGTEKVIESVKTEIGKKRLSGVADIKDLSDRSNGLRLVIECKSGVNPKALLAELWRYTPLETSFGIANLALVDGKPELLPLKRLLEVFLAHRLDVVTRRTQHRLDKAQARLHIVEGLLIALDNIDKVVKLIRAAKDTTVAKEQLQKRFKLSEIQATHILDMPLRRLVALEVENLRKEQTALEKEIAGYEKILGSEKELKKVVDTELAAVQDEFAVPRRSLLKASDDSPDLTVASSSGAASVDIPDEPCTLLLSNSGVLARTAVDGDHVMEPKRRAARTRHDTITSTCTVTSRGSALGITSTGRAVRISVLDVPAVPRTGAASARGGAAVSELADLRSGETLLAVAPADNTTGVLLVGTRDGVVKAVQPDWPARGEDFPIIGLKDRDTVVGAVWVDDVKNVDVVFVTSAGNLLRFPASNVRPQGRSGGGIAGVKLPPDTHVVAFTAVDTRTNPTVATFTGVTAKTTPLSEYPGKGRGTGGVRCHRFTKNESALTVAWVGVNPLAASRNGSPVTLPVVEGKRDGSGTPVSDVAAFGAGIELTDAHGSAAEGEPSQGTPSRRATGRTRNTRAGARAKTSSSGTRGSARRKSR